LEKLVVKHIMGDDGNFIDCKKCGNKIFFEEGKVDYRQKDD
jgi:DNA-directed RNA polymerase subunit RPC12/RpoP